MGRETLKWKPRKEKPVPCPGMIWDISKGGVMADKHRMKPQPGGPDGPVFYCKPITVRKVSKRPHKGT